MVAAAKDSGSVGMDRTDLKKSFKLARRRPINVAFALDGDGKAVILCDKLKKGPNLFRQLKQEAPDSKSHRFGIVEIDSNNQKLAIFTVNRPGGGLAKKLIKTLKGTGFSKVLIRLEDGTEVETHEEEDEDAEIDGAADDYGDDDEMEADDQGHSQQKVEVAGGATQADADGGIAQPQAADGNASSDMPADGTAQPQAGGPDAASLSTALTALVRQMLAVIATDPTKKAALVELATDAQASLKRGDLQQASAGMDILREALGSASDTTGQSAPNGATPAGSSPNGAAPNGAPPNGATGHSDPAAAAPAIAKARTAWVATRQKVEGDLGKLHTAFGGAFKGHDQEEAISKAFRERVETVLNALDEELAHTLEAVNNAKDPGEREQLVGKARSHLQRYQQHVANDSTIAALDSNPFVPMSVQKTVIGTIDALLRAIR